MPTSEMIHLRGTPLGVPQFLRRLAAMTAPGEDGLKAAHFKATGKAALLLAPQLLILLLFFYIPSWKALSLSVVDIDPFGGTSIFVGLQHFIDLINSPEYQNSLVLTFWFVLVQSLATLLIATVLAFATDQVVRGRLLYKSVILLPYAIAPVISGVIWAFLFNPAVGPLAEFLHGLGIPWDPNLRPHDAQILITAAAVWKHICYDYVFLVAAMLSVPQSLREAAAIDGAGSLRRFLTISLPLITPTVFFLLVMNFIYGMFDTFGIIHAVTYGGPGGATATLVYKVYQDGFVLMNLGASAAQSIILMGLAILFTILQFRAVERRVNYRT